MEQQMRSGQGAGFIPWSEGGALSLPPIRKGPIPTPPNPLAGAAGGGGGAAAFGEAAGAAAKAGAASGAASGAATGGATEPEREVKRRRLATSARNSGDRSIASQSIDVSAMGGGLPDR